MFIPEKVKRFNKLNAADKDLFKRVCTRFYKAWEYPEDHVPVKISRMDSKHLKDMGIIENFESQPVYELILKFKKHGRTYK